MIVSADGLAGFRLPSLWLIFVDLGMWANLVRTLIVLCRFKETFGNICPKVFQNDSKAINKSTPNLKATPRAADSLNGMKKKECLA